MSVQDPRTHVAPAALFGAAAAAVYFILVNATPFLNFAPESYGPYWAAGRWMMLHVCAGIAAVLVGVVQLALGFVGRTSRLHRWCGRTYVAAVFVACCASFVVLAHGSAIGAGFAALVSVLAGYTLIFTALGVLAIRRRDRLAHRAWMIRSYMAIMVFAFFRGAVETPLLSELPFAERFTALMGLTMSTALASTELVISMLRAGPSAVRPGPAPHPTPSVADSR